LLLAPGVLSKDAITASTALLSPPFSDATGIKRLLELGADPKAAGSNGQTLLMEAAASDLQPTDVIELLISNGADVNAVDPKGARALSLAGRRGGVLGVDVLLRSGGRDPGPAVPEAIRPAPALTVAAALARSVPLLQRNDVSALKKTGCVSCHNNT